MGGGESYKICIKKCKCKFLKQSTIRPLGVWPPGFLQRSRVRRFVFGTICNAKRLEATGMPIIRAQDPGNTACVHWAFHKAHAEVERKRFHKE